MSKVMQGFPPKQLNQVSLANWRKAPYCHWAFHHVRELVPSAEIKNDPENIWQLESGTFKTFITGLDEALIDLSQWYEFQGSAYFDVRVKVHARFDCRHTGRTK